MESDALHEESVALSGPILGGRDSQTKDTLLARFKALPANSLLVLDFGQVQFMDYSWADEVVASLLKASRRAKTPRLSSSAGPARASARALPPRCRCTG